MKVTRDSSGNATEVVMLKGADMHHHVRQGAILRMVMPMLMQRFHCGIVMPNLLPPVTTAAMVEAYLREIREATPVDKYPEHSFAPLMTMCLTDELHPREVEAAFRYISGVKYYPRGLTTNSDSGVKNPASLWTKGTRPYECLAMLDDMGKVLLLHAADGFDKGGNELDPFEQEPHFIRETLPRIRNAHPGLKISVEHISTVTGVDYLRVNGGSTLGCSITAQHLLLDRRDLFRGGFRPHRFWWPIIQSQEHKEELRKFAAEDHSYVWLGSDSAPHPKDKKETDCCSGGVLMVHAGLELYIEAFEDMGALDDRFERFACLNGPKFFRTADCGQAIKFVREEWTVRNTFMVASGPGGSQDKPVIPFRLGEKVRWKLVG